MMSEDESKGGSEGPAPRQSKLLKSKTPKSTPFHGLGASGNIVVFCLSKSL